MFTDLQTFIGSMRIGDVIREPSEADSLYGIAFDFLPPGPPIVHDLESADGLLQLAIRESILRRVLIISPYFSESEDQDLPVNHAAFPAWLDGIDYQGVGLFEIREMSVFERLFPRAKYEYDCNYVRDQNDLVRIKLGELHQTTAHLPVVEFVSFGSED